MPADGFGRFARSALALVFVPTLNPRNGRPDLPAASDPRRSAPSGTEEVKPLELCKEDRRKLYGLLDADVPEKLEQIVERAGRLEKLVAVLSASNALLVWKVLGSPAPAEVGAALVRLIFP